MKKLLLLATTLLTISNAGAAQVVDTVNNMENVKFVSAATPVTQNNIVFLPTAVLGGFNKDETGTESSDNYGNSFAVLSAAGIVLSVVNNGNAPAVISWKDSTINADGKSFGTPFVEGMKYKDAGNPVATPPTIVAPGQNANIMVFFPNVKFLGSSWNINGVPVRPSKNTNIVIYAMVNNQIVTISTPGINLVK